MRHRKNGVKLNRTTSHRQAMFRNMVTSLLKYNRITTTEAKAKELRRWADQIITLAKRGDLHARRLAMAIVREKAVVHRVFEEASDRFGSIKGGYTRLVKIRHRAGDAAPLTLVELTHSVVGKPAKKKKTRKPSKGKPVPSQAKTEIPSAAITQTASAAGAAESMPTDETAEVKPEKKPLASADAAENEK